jgi:hypothetical protein
MLQEFNTEVADLIKGSSDKVKTIVRDKFVNDEINKRADLLSRLIVALNTFRKEALKVRADVVTYNESGEKQSESWSKAQLDKKKKADEKIGKAEKAFEKALNDNDYSTIEQVIKELQANTKPDGKAEAKPDAEAESN